MRLYLIRHPRPREAAGRCYGRLDLDLDAPPAAAAARIAARLPADFRQWPLWSSPARRCWQLAAALHPAPHADARLLEMDFGAWEGRRWDDIARAALDAWAADPAGFAAPGGGESGRAVLARARACLATAQAAGLDRLILVTHAGILRALLADHYRLQSRHWPALRFAYEEVVTLDV